MDYSRLIVNAESKPGQNRPYGQNRYRIPYILGENTLYSISIPKPTIHYYGNNPVNFKHLVQRDKVLTSG